MPYPLRTPRLALSPLTTGDIPAFVAYRQDADVARWQGWDSSYNETDAAGLVASQPTTELPGPGGWLQLAIRNPEDGTLYGDIAIHSLDEFHDTFEIGITLARSNQHRGIAREAVMRVLDHLFTSANAYRVTANCDTRNAPVAKLLTAVGMNKESTEADVEFSKGEWITLDSYAILKREFLRSPDTVAPG